MNSMYHVVSAYSLIDLRKEVNDLVQQGYDPQGGLTVSGDPAVGKGVFYQAMYIPNHPVIQHRDLVVSLVDEPLKVDLPKPRNRKR